MIWTVDPLTFCLATLILVSALLAIGSWTRSARAALLIVALAANFGLSLLFGERLGGFTELAPITWIGGIAAIALALVARSQPPAYTLSLGVLVCVAASIAGFGNFPTGWAGLLHQIAVLDISAVCLATTWMGTFYAPKPAISNQSASDDPTDKPSRSDWIDLPPRLGRRTGVMFAIVCGSLAYALYSDGRLFGLPELIGLWAAGSEVLAAAVAWRVTQRWIKPGVEADRLGWRLKLGLMIAGMAASIGMLLMPVIIAAAATLRG